MQTDSVHQSDAPLGLTLCSWLLTCAHTAWKSISAPLFFCTSGQETVENLKISRGQLAPCQEKRIQRQQTVSYARCKVLPPNTGFLLASMPSYCRCRPIECLCSQSVSVSVPKDKIRGSAIQYAPQPIVEARTHLRRAPFPRRLRPVSFRLISLGGCISKTNAPRRFDV